MGDDELLVVIADSWETCDYCGAAIDAPGLCGRCLRELNEQLEDMRGAPGGRW